VLELSELLDELGPDHDVHVVEQEREQQPVAVRRPLRDGPLERQREQGDQGADVMIFEIFSPKNSAKKLAFFAKTTACFCKNLIITLVFEKNANFFVENWQKLQKIVIITSTPDLNFRRFSPILAKNGVFTKANVTVPFLNKLYSSIFNKTANFFAKYFGEKITVRIFETFFLVPWI
jgi:hypothetical protein